jgi:hypothetical protein
MAIFTVIPTKDDHKINQALTTAGLNFYTLPRGEFLVSYKGTSIELSNLLGITDGSQGLAIVLAIGSYYGRASTDTWEWIKTHWEA